MIANLPDIIVYKRCRILLMMLLPAITCLAQTKIAGVKTILPGIQDGYILFNPVGQKVAYLIDNCGRVVNTWHSEYSAGHTIYLKPNGNLVRTRVLDPKAPGGSGGGVEILDWESNLLWSYTYFTDIVWQHHDISVLPNGNILILAWEKKTRDESISAGRNPALILNNEVWPEHLVEVRPIVPNGGQIVWEWHAWDHLIQDFDATKANYGVVENHPELIDLNYTTAGQKDWIHGNAIDYNQQLDQIIISAHSFDEIWVIDHSTTSAEARTHSGGRTNKGGDLLYRWGNPMAYRRGTAADTKLFAQHHTHWIAPGLDHEGKIMYFNNGGNDRPYSSVEIIDPPITVDGNYVLDGNAYGPAAPDLIYTGTPLAALFSRNMSSAQVLPNGNLFISSAQQGRTIEVNANSEIIWEYKNPISPIGVVGRTYFTTDPAFPSQMVFRTIKYPSTYAAFNGRNLTPQEPIEGQPWADCSLVTGTEETIAKVPLAYPNPADDVIHVEWPGQSLRATLIDAQGRKLQQANAMDKLSISTGAVPAGLYLLRVNDHVLKVIVKH